MKHSVNVNIRMEEDIKKKAEKLFAEFGINMTTAIMMFVKAVIRERRIPFEISADTDDFYNDYNQQVLKERIAGIDNGKFVVKTMEELEKMENE